MYTYKDFSRIYCCSSKTIYNRIKNILPILKNYTLKKRKRMFTQQEAKTVIKHIGIPPDNKDNRNLAENFPHLFI